MADGYGFGRTVREEDFEEEEVWAILRERKDSSPKSRKGKDSFSSSPRHIPSTACKISKSILYLEDDGRLFQQSAPVNIPDWSQIHKKGSSNRQMNGDDDGIEISDNGDGDDDEDMMPPHEWIAKKLARSQISSFSVCEGAGRTLKGRDLCKVRNAVLTRTGFLERSSSS